MTEYQIFKKAIETYGEREQSAMVMEECGELIRAVNKMHREPTAVHRCDLLSEIADVLVMIDQLLIMYNLSINNVERARKNKVERLRRRLDPDSPEHDDHDVSGLLDD